MKQYTNNHIRFAEVLTHVIGWGIVFGFPFFIINRGGEAIDWMGYLRHSGVSLSFFIVSQLLPAYTPIFIQWTHPRIYVAQPRVDHTYEWRSSSMAKRPFWQYSTESSP